MADSDKTLKLLIELGVIGKEDAMAAQQLLKETGAATTKTATATDALGESEKAAAGHTEKLHLNHRALHQIMNLIGKETAPELGHALAGALYGPIGIALAVGYAFEAIRTHIAETNKELDAMGEKAAEAYANVKANLFDAIRNEEFSTEKLDKFFKNIEDNSKRAQTAIEDALKVAHELESATIKQLKADEANELARAKISGAGPLAEAEIKNRYAAQIAVQEDKGPQDEVNAIKQEMAEKQRLLDELLMQQHRMGGIAPETMAAIDAAIAKMPKANQDAYAKERADGTFDYAKVLNEWSSKNAQDAAAKAAKDLGHGEKEGDEAAAKKLHEKFDALLASWKSEIQLIQKQILENFAHPEHLPRGVTPESWQKNAEKYIGELNKKINATGVEQIDLKVAQDKAYIEQQKTAEAALKLQAAATKKLTEEIDKYRQEIIEAQEKLRTTSTIAGIKTGATDATTKTAADTERLTAAAGTPAGKTITEGFALADIVEKHGKLDVEQQRLLMAIARQLGFNVKDVKAAADALESVKNSKEGFIGAVTAFANYAESNNKAVADHTRRIEELAKQLASGRNLVNGG